MAKIIRYYCDMCDTEVSREEELISTIICHQECAEDWSSPMIYHEELVKYDKFDVCHECKRKLDKYYLQATGRLLRELRDK